MRVRDKKAQVITLLKETFCHFQNYETISPDMIRKFMRSPQSQLSDKELEEFCLNIYDGHNSSFWERVENLLHYVLIKKSTEDNLKNSVQN